MIIFMYCMYSTNVLYDYIYDVFNMMICCMYIYYILSSVYCSCIQLYVGIRVEVAFRLVPDRSYCLQRGCKPPRVWNDDRRGDTLAEEGSECHSKQAFRGRQSKGARRMAQPDTSLAEVHLSP